MSDTVGFIDRLPHTLVAAFRATLEETADADLVLHVIDASNPERERHVAAVTRVLEEVGAIEVPRVEVYNKIDADLRRRAPPHPGGRSVGAADLRAHRRGLRRAARKRGRRGWRSIRSASPIELDLANPVHAERLAWLYRHATVHSHATMGDRATLEADVPRRLLPMVGLATPRDREDRRTSWVSHGSRQR